MYPFSSTWLIHDDHSTCSQSNTWPSIFQLVPTLETAPSWEALLMWRQLYQGGICSIQPWQGTRDPANYDAWKHLVKVTGSGERVCVSLSLSVYVTCFLMVDFEF